MAALPMLLNEVQQQNSIAAMEQYAQLKDLKQQQTTAVRRGQLNDIQEKLAQIQVVLLNLQAQDGVSPIAGPAPIW
jgi:hypothetical protein